jgi:prepilin-type N-terminal cleavage/methylation domain-containing protein
MAIGLSVMQGGWVMKRARAFTLIELMTVIAIISALVAVSLPNLSRSREEAKRTVCMANERGIGQAFYLYAMDAPDPGNFPAICQTTTATSSNFRMFYSQDRSVEPSTSGVPSPTVDMWAVVRRVYTVPKQFICPSTTDIPDPAADTTVYYDFASINSLSYGYQFQHSPNRRIIGMASEPVFPVLADGNPYIKGGISPSITLPADRGGSGRGNSLNHNREGQNVLYQDSHVEFENGPDVGLSGRVLNIPWSRGRDNCYSYFTSITASSVDPGSDKPSWTPGGAGTVLLGGKSDACLLP